MAIWEMWDKLAPDKVQFIKAAAERAHPHGGSGGVPKLLELRAVLFLTLPDHGESNVILAKNQAHKWLLEQAEQWRNMFDRRHDKSSFE
jgi:hypothetical protein